jgi:hypothetical protein
MHKNKILIFIDHDLVIRHFIKSGVFREVESEFDTKYVFHCEPGASYTGIFHDVSSLGLQHVLQFELPRRRMGAWYPLYAVTALRKQLGTENFGPLRQRIAETIGKGGGWRSWRYVALGLPGAYQAFRWLQLRKMGVYEPLAELIRNERPDIILHPSLLAGYFINELGPIANELGIPFVAMMNSFDNPSQKAVCSSLPDKLIVWGPQTREHAIRFMGMPPDSVEVFGAAQFQIYRKPVTESDAELRALFQVPADVPIVLYGGVSKRVDETRHLKLLDEAITSGAVAPCHILYRPHPWRTRLSRGEEDFFSQKFKHVTMDPHLVERYKGIVQEPNIALFMADYDVLRKLMVLIDAAISPLSTLMVEVILHQKPVLSFFPQEDLENKYGEAATTNISFRLAHFRGFFDSPGVHRCNEASKLVEALNKLLEEAKNPAIADALKKHADYYAEMSGPPYGQRLCQLVQDLTSEKRSGNIRPVPEMVD